MANLKVFIGSSTEGATQQTQGGVLLLNKVAEWIEGKGHTPVRWNDTTSFPAGEFTLESLVRTARTVDAAVFILSDDDAASSRGTNVKMPRDNVLIEYGLFMGTLGEKNVIAGSRGQPKVASDLSGLTLVDLSDNNLVRAEAKVFQWLQEVEDRLLAPEMQAADTLSQYPYVELIASVPDRSDATVHAINELGNLLFGFGTNKNLVGEKADVLPHMLRQWIDPPRVHWDDLEEDQKLVYKQFYEEGRAWASIPVQFNKEHPTFSNKSFIPIIVQQRFVREKERKREITGVLYLDVASLPRALFIERVWDEVSRSLDLGQLVDEVKVIAVAVNGKVPSFSGSKSEGPSLLAYFAEIGLFQAYDIAHAKNLVQVKNLLRAVLLRLPDTGAEEGKH